MAILEVKNLNFSYVYGSYSKEVLKNINFKVEEGDIVAVIGENGAGKSTLLKNIIMLLPDYTGEIFIAGEKIDKKNIKFVRKIIGYLFQNSENQLFFPNIYEDMNFFLKNLGYKKSLINEKINSVLEKLNILSLRNEYIFRLSGGEKKLCAIASIIIHEPKILLLDEPTGSLDPKNRRKIINILKEIKATKIIATHDLDLVRSISNKTMLLFNGEIVKFSDTNEIINDEKELLEKGL